MVRCTSEGLLKVPRLLMSANDLTRCSALSQLFLAIVLRAAVAAAAVLRLFDLGMAENLEPKKCRCLKKMVCCIFQLLLIAIK